MKVRQISVKVGRTLNFGNFESAKVEVVLTADLEEDENPDEAFEDLYEGARTKLVGKVRALVE